MLLGTLREGEGRIVRRDWVDHAITLIEADYCRSADTHLIKLGLPRAPGITLYLKDESTHPTGSLKHRLARSLILHALCSGWIAPDTTLVEASSGSTAVSEAYFASLLGLRFVAVAPATTAHAKIAAIEFHGGQVHMVDDPGTVYAEAERIAAECGGLYLDQFTYAERATDWRGNNNIAQSIFDQMTQEPCPVPDWIVCGAGTGGTSATIGRFIRYARHPTKLCVADPVTSVFHRHFADRSVTNSPTKPSRIEGIGRPRVEPSFVPDVIDRMIAVPDARSIGAMRSIERRLGYPVGGSTGTNIAACYELVSEMVAQGKSGSITTILCDSGRRYADTLGSDAWLDAQGIAWQPHAEEIDRLIGP